MGTERMWKLHMERPEAYSRTFFLFIYFSFFFICYNYKEACLVLQKSSWNSETSLCVGSGNVSFTTKCSVV